MSVRISGSSAEKASSMSMTSELDVKRTGDTDTLLHPAGELMGVSGCRVPLETRHD